MANAKKLNNVQFKDKIPVTDENSSAEQQLLYNFSILSNLGYIVRFNATDGENVIILKVDYDDYKSTYPATFYFHDKELFYKFFEEI